MFKVKRNQVVISALVVMIGAAGYLNYSDTQNNSTPIALNDNGDIVSLIPDSNIAVDENPSIAVSTNNETPAPSETALPKTGDATNENSVPGEAIFVNATTDESYFVQAKLEREQARSKQKDILMEVVGNENLENEKKSQAADEILQIQQRIEKETASEAMIESKGFKGVYVRIDDTTVDVVVNKLQLTDPEIAQIQDIVSRKTGMSADKIRINTLKK